MDDFNFFIEGDTLFRNEITKTDVPNMFQVRKVPVITKEVFVTCFNEWIKGGEKNDAAAE